MKHATPEPVRKLGLLLSAPPAHPNFNRSLRLAEAAIKKGVQVYFYCIDEAVHGLGNERLRHLEQQGLKLFACAYGARRRGIACSDEAVFGGLAILDDLIAATDRFVSFHGTVAG
jgi:sulfur relay (sulfurtransferase) complex TusBCD TusD component (DsrE family)